MKSFRAIWLIVGIIAILEVFTPLAYSNNVVRYIFQATALFGFFFMLWKDKDDVKRIYSFVFAVLFVVTIGSFVLRFFSFGAPYKLQTITHRHKKIENCRIEFLWSDIGALGYNKKTELVFPLTPFFEWRVSNFHFDSNTWIEVNEEINELGLRGG